MKLDTRVALALAPGGLLCLCAGALGLAGFGWLAAATAALAR